MRAGETRTFNYTGNVQAYEVESSGLYQIEVWGGQGDGLGGYAKGYKRLKKGTILYIAVGGRGANTNPFYGHGGINAGGWNGGGNGCNYIRDPEVYDSYNFGGGGGGATHIALVSGTLASIGYNSFVTQGNGLIVAGGGGGGCVDYRGPRVYDGGSGGGTNGGGSSSGSGGGGQSGGGSGIFGAGGSYSGQFGGGGGGGFYGGAGSKEKAAGGGSGWIGGVPAFEYKGVTYSPTMSNAQRSGAGMAKLTKMGGATVYYGEKECSVFLGDIEIDDIYFGDVELG